MASLPPDYGEKRGGGGGDAERGASVAGPPGPQVTLTALQLVLALMSVMIVRRARLLSLPAFI